MNDSNTIIEALEQGDLAMMLAEPPISFQRIYVDITGSVNAALLISVIVSEIAIEGRDPLQWQDASAEDWTALTGLTRKEQETARRTLRDLHLLQERRVGYPAQFQVRVDFERLNKCLLQLAKTAAAKRQKAEAAFGHGHAPTYMPAFHDHLFH